MNRDIAYDARRLGCTPVSPYRLLGSASSLSFAASFHVRLIPLLRFRLLLTGRIPTTYRHRLHFRP